MFEVEGSYNYYIVILSVIIAILSSYLALNMAAKISHATGKARYTWLIAGSFVMGSGVWSMHFVGMLAFSLHATVEYDVWLTILSMAASVISSFIAFYITMPKDINWAKIAVGGIVMASGIVAMHYVGMEAMIMPVEISYDPLLWILSAVIAFVASYAALILFLRFRSRTSTSWMKWLSAVVMGGAVSGMHYTGMAAANFEGHDMVHYHPQDVESFLLYGVTATVFFIIFVSWAAMLFDRHVLERMAYTDTITGLPNRHEMNRFFQTYSGHATLGVLFLDLDQFKAVNDTLGHTIGDRLIEKVGNRLRRFLSEDQRVFRIGGDEFLVVVKRCDQQRAERLAVEILNVVKQVYRIDGNELYITGSVGICIGNTHEMDLLRNADTAMYKAKGSGKNRYFVYTEEMGTREVRKMELEKDLLQALEQQQFFIEYQPKWNVRKNDLVGFEALIRWQHPRLGVVAPGEFIGIAEETGLIVPITEWTLFEACRACQDWQARGIEQAVSVNLSVRLFQSDRLVELVDRVLGETGLEPKYLELEITESMVFLDIEDIVRQLDELRALGVRVSMDDFGTGYSSIGLLDRLPLDALKLDRLFTQDLETPSKRAIIHAIVLMAEQLKLDVIAEGVENEEHIEFLTGLGCYVMQGYYYGKPMKDEEIDEWMEQNSERVGGVS